MSDSTRLLVIPALCVAAAICGTGVRAESWQPSAGNTQTPIWPGAAPDAKPVPAQEKVTVSKKLLAGMPTTAVTNVTRPTVTIYAPEGKNTKAAIIVIPGGGFEMLAIDLEGTEICNWVTSEGITWFY
jgi:hypothetical protein